jgi:tetratricopeptide (TPR) repeat protein
LEPLASNALALNDALFELSKYSLLRRDPNARCLEIHRLVQAVLKEAIDEPTQRVWAERAVRAVARCFPFPDIEFSTWGFCEKLMPQADACAELIKQWGFEFLEASQLLNQADFYLYKRGRYTEGESRYKHALTVREKSLGVEHPYVAVTLNGIAELYRAQGHYAKAEPLFQRSLAILEKALGPDNVNLAATLNNLALLLVDQGQYAKAEPLYGRALAIRVKALGPEHPYVATSLNNLALLYNYQGQYDKAESLYRRSLAIYENAPGTNPFHLGNILCNLAGLYVMQEKYDQAESLCRRALAILEEAPGPHPDMATCLEIYAWLLRKINRTDEAAPLESRASAIRSMLR